MVSIGAGDQWSEDGTLHGELEPCRQCGRPKSEYEDRGVGGYYRCWWCNERGPD